MHTRFPDRGFALVVVLVAAVCMLGFFAAFQYYSQSEYRNLERILNNTTLDYLVRAGLNIAEDKLLKDRWFAPSNSGEFEVPLADLPISISQAKIKIFVDEYLMGPAYMRTIGTKKYPMLDHIKVYVQATLRDKQMFGFGKFIISPEPTAIGNSTVGVDMSFGSLDPCPNTFRKMINVKLLRPDDLETVPGFSAIDDRMSRKALGNFLSSEFHEQAKNYAKNLVLSEKIQQGLQNPQPTYQLGDLKSMILGFAQSPAAGNLSPNQFSNKFIIENLKDFFMTSSWDLTDSEKDTELRKVRIEIGMFPPDPLTPEIGQAIGKVFGGGNPKVARDGVEYYKVIKYGPGGSAFTQFFGKLGLNNPPDKAPKDFQTDVSRAITDWSYSFEWKAVNIPDSPPSTGVHDDSSGDAGNFLYHMAQHPGQVKIQSKSGPTPEYTNYYVVKDSIYMPMPFVFNVFLKYVDESYTYFPDEVIKNESNYAIPLPPEPPSGGGGGGWGGIKG